MDKHKQAQTWWRTFLPDFTMEESIIGIKGCGFLFVTNCRSTKRQLFFAAFQNKNITRNNKIRLLPGLRKKKKNKQQAAACQIDRPDFPGRLCIGLIGRCGWAPLFDWDPSKCWDSSLVTSEDDHGKWDGGWYRKNPMRKAFLTMKLIRRKWSSCFFQHNFCMYYYIFLFGKHLWCFCEKKKYMPSRELTLSPLQVASGRWFSDLGGIWYVSSQQGIRGGSSQLVGGSSPK